MKSAGQILFDLLLYFIVNGNLLAVHNFLHSLTVLVLAGNLCGNLNGLEVILLLHAHSDDAFRDLAHFLGSRFRGNDLSMIEQVGHLSS